MLEVGLEGRKELIVTPEVTAKRVCSGALDVFATPCMIAMMENTAFESVLEHLDEGCGTVGTMVNIRHLSATPIGMKVTCKTRLIRIDGRALTFQVEAYDELGLIGEGEHERFIIREQSFQEKTNNKGK